MKSDIKLLWSARGLTNTVYNKACGHLPSRTLSHTQLPSRLMTSDVADDLFSSLTGGGEAEEVAGQAELLLVQPPIPTDIRQVPHPGQHLGWLSRGFKDSSNSLTCNTWTIHHHDWNNTIFMHSQEELKDRKKKVCKRQRQHFSLSHTDFKNDILESQSIHHWWLNH